MGLTWSQDLAYRRLLDSYYSTGTLPTDRDELHQIARATNEDERAAVDKVVKKYFRVEGDHLLQNRVEREFAERRDYIASQSEKGIKSGEARRKKSAGAADQESNRGSTGVQPGSNRGSIPVASGFEPTENLPSPSPPPSRSASALPREKPTVLKDFVVCESVSPDASSAPLDGGHGATGDDGGGDGKGAGKEKHPAEKVDRAKIERVVSAIRAQLPGAGEAT